MLCYPLAQGEPYVQACTRWSRSPCHGGSPQSSLTHALETHGDNMAALFPHSTLFSLLHAGKVHWCHTSCKGAPTQIAYTFQVALATSSRPLPHRYTLMNLAPVSSFQRSMGQVQPCPPSAEEGEAIRIISCEDSWPMVIVLSLTAQCGEWDGDRDYLLQAVRRRL